jgi:hypothetical protein
MKHAISHESRTWLGWPSIQEASEILRKRIAREVRIRMLRRNLYVAVRDIEREIRRAA